MQHIDNGKAIAILGTCTCKMDMQNIRKHLIGLKFGYSRASAKDRKSGMFEDFTVSYASPDREKELLKFIEMLKPEKTILFIHANGKSELLGQETKHLGRFHQEHIDIWLQSIGLKNHVFSVRSESIEGFWQASEDVQLVNISEAAMFECLCRELKRRTYSE